MPVPGPRRGRGRFDRCDVERPAVPQRHDGRKARQHSARRRGQAVGPEVIDAVFQVRDDLRRIGQEERRPLSLDVAHWQAETEMVEQIAAV